MVVKIEPSRGFPAKGRISSIIQVSPPRSGGSGPGPGLLGDQAAVLVVVGAAHQHVSLGALDRGQLGPELLVALVVAFVHITWPPSLVKRSLKNWCRATV